MPWAQELGLEGAVELLDATLAEEKKTDELLTELAESSVNQHARRHKGKTVFIPPPGSPPRVLKANSKAGGNVRAVSVFPIQTETCHGRKSS
jgi:hypothetical protein